MLTDALPFMAQAKLEDFPLSIYISNNLRTTVNTICKLDVIWQLKQTLQCSADPDGQIPVLHICLLSRQVIVPGANTLCP